MVARRGILSTQISNRGYKENNMGKTFKDRRKFERKHDRNDGLKEPKREPKRRRPDIVEDDDEPEPYSDFDDDMN
jgi:hypothetical protein